MTDCALAATPVVARARRRPPRRALPPGVPRWAWLLGVTVVPLTRDDGTPDSRWVVSAGAGTTHVAALLRDDDHTTDRPERPRP